ncbi:MAG: M13 family metallopeptidase, partial [Oscillospiraceae bacterium]
GTDDGGLHADENVTTEQMMIMIRRVWSLFGTNLKDDFYKTVNKSLLDNSVIKTGKASTSTVEKVSNENTEKVDAIIKEMREGTFEEGSHEQKVSNFYNSIMDIETRNKMGVKPIQKYIDDIDSAKTIKDLFDTQATAINDLGKTTLMDFVVMADLSNNVVNSIYLGLPETSLTKEEYAAEIGDKQQAYIDYIAKFLTFAGETSEDSLKHANMLYDFEKEISKASLNVEDYSNVDKLNNKYTLDELKAVFPGVDIDQVLKDCGIKTPEFVVVTDTGMTKLFGEYLNDDNLEIIKIVSKNNLLQTYGRFLDERFADATYEYKKISRGIEGKTTNEEFASDETQNLMSDYLGEIYAKRYFSEEAKKDVESMVSEFLSIFKGRIETIDWMSDTTKEMALKKLETMKVNVGYPDKWESVCDTIDIEGPSNDKNTFFENTAKIKKAKLAKSLAQQGQPVKKDAWGMPIYMVNAFYNLTTNAIVFPAGILQSSFYDVNNSREQNLGGIGTVIAHEITHAFDNNGAKFDEKGNAANWWTEEDYENFNALCEKAIDKFADVEVAPGIVSNGKLTLSENIADMGGLSCALEAMKNIDNPDYDIFFRQYAEIFCLSGNREYMTQHTQMDVHSPSKNRTNITVSNFNEFYETYGVKEGDGMFVAPENRLMIW